jgi:hypothetical protein
VKGSLLIMALLAVPLTSSAGPVLDLADPRLDDTGPGDYLYPIHPYFFRRGVFDLKQFRVRDAGSDWRFELTVDLETPRPVEARATRARPIQFEQNVFFQNFDIYIRTPDADLKTAAGEPRLHDEAVPGRNFRFAAGHEWNRVVVVSPYPFHVRTLLRDWTGAEDAIVPANVQRIGPRFIVRVPKSDIGFGAPADWRFAVVVSGAVPLVQGYVRADHPNPNALTMPVRPNPGPEFFGGGDLTRYNPAVIDLLAPTPEAQYELLAGDGPGHRTRPVELRLLSPRNW